MSDSLVRPVLKLIGRPGCCLCDEADEMLMHLLEERAARGLLTPQVTRTDVSTDPSLEERYGMRVPVMAIGDDEIGPVTGSDQVRALLERAMPALA
jgi:hypothetical protein